MSERVGELRRLYMEMGEHCHVLARLEKDALLASKDRLEEARQKVAAARIVVWTELREEVMQEWSNETDTPMMFDKYPPKDMPGKS